MRPTLRGRFTADAARWIATAVALLWALHPLQTETVTCVVQRTEALVALFYLLTLYLFVRGVEASEPQVWHSAALVACLLGMASKEVMVTAPLIVVLYDRTFVAGTFREAWRQRKEFYALLAATWLVLGWLVIREGGARGAVAGFGFGITPWSYALTQCNALVHYGVLAVWPHALILDYGSEVTASVRDALPAALVLAVLLAGTITALRRHPVVGFVAAWFFVILAPSSSVVPLVSQTVAEHRMYLPLASVVVFAAVGLWTLIGRRSLLIGASVALGFGAIAIHRNEAYRSNVAIWTDTVAKRPLNARAHHNLGYTLYQAGRLDAAMAEYQIALRLNPTYTQAYHDLGVALYRAGRFVDAIAPLETALKIGPETGALHGDFASTLIQSRQRIPDAIAHYQTALQLQPNNIDARCSLASVFDWLGNRAEAIRYYEAALQLDPDRPGLKENLARLRSGAAK